jgi:glycosyltransferase involved in cell wall biosynthesis
VTFVYLQSKKKKQGEIFAIDKPITISILIPCYNCEKTIDWTINSCLSQTYNDELIKIICLDDGSNDQTLKILINYQSKYPNKFSVLHRENRGHSETSGDLISKVETDYFCFCDSDDYLSNDSIKN